ncbi:MAG TPA: DUF1549 and DUF1553 domain-containing protein [Gemmataceae bacterium]|jgi:hypothetical protein
MDSIGVAPTANRLGRRSHVRHGTVGIGFALAALFAMPISARAESVSFRNDVMAVLSKAGCNQGTCHGNQNGKNGFKLSLRGQDPDFDLASLTRDTQGRRLDSLKPEESLILLKATAKIPHEGGRRFTASSPEYAILAKWIGGGAKPDTADQPRLLRIEPTPAERVLIEPEESVPLRVRAFFSNGEERDVTRMAVYEPSNPLVSVSLAGEARRLQFGESAILVRYLDAQATVQVAFVPERKGFVWRDVPEANFIDHHVFAKLKKLRMQPSELCPDSTFLRRAYLDVLGVLPTAEEARAFLSDTRADKRTRLIDQLLDRPEFADFWALKWSDILRSEEKVLDRKGVEVFHDWIRRSIAENKPLDAFARELIAARGSTYAEPAANFYRALRDPSTRAEAAAEVFLGVRLQCARCHNHPFDRWTQNDYHNFAAFFSRVQYRIVENRRRDKLDTHEFDGEQIVWMAREGEIKHPYSGATMHPQFLGAKTPDFASDADRLEALADWVASPENPMFARTQVNRVWYHMMGRGIVEPNDDFRASNPPSNGPLLKALTKDIIAHRFDLRYLVRTIMNSRTYQLSAIPNETNREDEANFAHALNRPLQAEQLLDAIAQVTGTPLKFPGYPAGTRAAQLAGVRFYDRKPSESERFLQTFGKPDRLLSCECERSDETTLGQAFQLITGELINRCVSENDNSLGKMLHGGRSDRKIVEELYLRALCRLPSEEEWRDAKKQVEKSKDRRAALEDLAWGLLNAKEFLLRP